MNQQFQHIQEEKSATRAFSGTSKGTKQGLTRNRALTGTNSVAGMMAKLHTGETGGSSANARKYGSTRQRPGVSSKNSSIHKAPECKLTAPPAPPAPLVKPASVTPKYSFISIAQQLAEAAGGANDKSGASKKPMKFISSNTISRCKVGAEAALVGRATIDAERMRKEKSLRANLAIAPCTTSSNYGTGAGAKTSKA